MARNIDLNQQRNLPESVKFQSINKLKLATKREHSTTFERTEVPPTRKADLTATVSNLTKDLRFSFSNGMSKVCESHVSTRLKARFRKIARIARQEQGSHSFLFSKFGDSLKGFTFNSDYPFHEVFTGKYFITNGSNRGHIILHFPAFVPVEALRKPKDATHFKLYSQMLALSDFEFDPQVGYKPVTKKFHGKKSEFYSQIMPILKIPTQPITSQLSVNNGLGIPESSGLLLVMGVHFYKYENCRYSPMSRESCLDIVKVF